MNSIRTLSCVYQNISISSTDAVKLRGFFANQDTGDVNLHNHNADGSDVFQYPKVQYKVINGHPLIVAWQEGVDSILPLVIREEPLWIGHESYGDINRAIYLGREVLRTTDVLRDYRFITPWMALNQKNYSNYIALDANEKNQLLSRILIGNILSMYRGMGVEVSERIFANHNLRERVVSYKNERMIAFEGDFHVNCVIPDYFGIGKGVSRGMGTVFSV